MQISCICYFAIFVQIRMKFPLKCRTKKLGMLYTILGSFCSFLNWKRADISPQIRLRKILVLGHFSRFFSPKDSFRNNTVSYSLDPDQAIHSVGRTGSKLLNLA